MVFLQLLDKVNLIKFLKYYDCNLFEFLNINKIEFEMCFYRSNFDYIYWYMRCEI